MVRGYYEFSSLAQFIHKTPEAVSLKYFYCNFGNLIGQFILEMNYIIKPCIPDYKIWRGGDWIIFKRYFFDIGVSITVKQCKSTWLVIIIQCTSGGYIQCFCELISCGRAFSAGYFYYIRFNISCLCTSKN